MLKSIKEKVLANKLRLILILSSLIILFFVFILSNQLGPKFRAVFGIITFIIFIWGCSRNPEKVDWKTVVGGLSLQIVLALFVLKFSLGRDLFNIIGRAVEKFLAFSDKGAQFVFGSLAQSSTMDQIFGTGRGFVFAFRALPTIIFVSSFFTILYHLGVLQAIVKVMAKVMVKIMGTSGSESLSAAANVFMGQTEAPLIIKPYLATMTKSELMAVMTGGFATISGGVMAVYIQMGADATALLTTSVMAAPCSLMLAKILYPEQEESLTRGVVKLNVEKQDRNIIDATAHGASDGLQLALNVAAMLIAFLAIIALIDHLLSIVKWGNVQENLNWFSIFGLHIGSPASTCGDGCNVLSLRQIFSFVFYPVALLLGVPIDDVTATASLLGTKLVANEFVAYLDLTGEVGQHMSNTAKIISTFALCGFANFGSVGIQIGGIGALIPNRRSDLAMVGMRALLAGFVATMINAAIAGILIA